MKERPKLEINWESSLFESDCNTGTPMVRLHNLTFKEIGTHPGAWIRITSKSSWKTVYRIGRGSYKGLQGLRKDTIMVDLGAMYDLEVMKLKDKKARRKRRSGSITNANGEERRAYKADWIISKAGLIDSIRANLQHPDHGYRTSMQVAFLGLLIGALGLLTSIFGCIKQ